jgi:DNA-binding helix-hairpin-helix protein with protein kinase domain
VNPVVDANSKPVRLGAEIARGGEGIVYEVPTDPSVVAKIYLRTPDRNKIGKLSAMRSVAAQDILKFAAWPITTLHQNGSIVGILMPKVPTGSKAIHELYTPKTRLREYPSANWQFLVNVATNVTRAFAAIHRSGHVIGDVNHGNILVGPNGIASFIDCDSFQIRANGQIFLCEVGVSTYTPPELQNKTFNQIVRTENHDAFGLAVLIFHLLFMGRHPFAGRYSGNGYMPIERAIGECRFAFGRLGKQMQMSPPPDSLLLSQIAVTVSDAFERAFSPEAARGASRPTPMEWLSLLEQFQRNLTRCKSNPVHVYYAQVSECPWCKIEAHGVVLFIDVGIATTGGLNIDVLWTKLNGLPALGSIPPVPTLASLNIRVQPTLEASALGRNRKLRIALGVLAVIVSVCIVIGANLSLFPSVILITVTIIFACKIPQELQRKRATALDAIGKCQSEYQALQARYLSEGSGEKFAAKVKELNSLRSEYTQLPLIRQKKIQELEKSKFQLQLQQFLDRISLSDAKIPSIGPGRKAMLASFGIDTAADVSYGAVTQVPGIGPKYADNLLAWRRTMEGRFRFNPTGAIPKSDVDRVDREVRNRRSELEGSLTRGVQEAAALHSRILTVRKMCHSQIENVLKSLAQAEANARVS